MPFFLRLLQKLHLPSIVKVDDDDGDDGNSDDATHDKRESKPTYPSPTPRHQPRLDPRSKLPANLQFILLDS